MVDGGWWMACTERSRSVDGEFSYQLSTVNYQLFKAP